jgi:hypothetical protein
MLNEEGQKKEVIRDRREWPNRRPVKRGFEAFVLRRKFSGGRRPQKMKAVDLSDRRKHG